MKRLLLAMAAPLALASCSGGSENVPLAAEITAPAVGAFVSGVVGVEVSFDGPVASLHLMDGAVELATATVAGGETRTATVEWDTTGVADGTVELTVRAASSGSDEAVSEPVAVVVDNTPPVVSIDLARMSLLLGTAEVPIVVEEDNLASVRLVSRTAGELSSVEGGAPASLSVDTTAHPSRVHWLSVEAVDEAGHGATSAEVPVLFANGGEEISVQYVPSAWVSIPADYSGTEEIHTRIVALMPTRPVARVVSWITWDPSEGDWFLEYTIGQGVCPHRGVAYLLETSRDGEIILDLAWTEVDPADQAAARALAPDHPADATSFPYNGDPATCGAFFGHVAEMAPTEHLGESVLFTAHYVVIYDDE